MTDLVAMRGKVRAYLSPRTDDITWPQELIDAALRRALTSYELYGPTLEAEFTVSTAGEEQDLSQGAGAVANIFKLVQVAYPLVANTVFWDDTCMWRTTDNSGLKIKMWRRNTPYTPATSEKIGVRYQQRQTIEDLEGATATTFPDHYDTNISIGAAGYACDQRVLDLAEDASAAADAIETLDRRAASYLGEFSSFLSMMAAMALRQPRWLQVGQEKNIGLLLAGRRGR